MKLAKPATRKELTEQTFHLISAIQNISAAFIDLKQRVEKLEVYRDALTEGAISAFKEEQSAHVD